MKFRKNKLKVGIIGAGRIANIAHCPSLAEIKSVKIVAACDTNEKQLERIANNFSIPNTYKNYKKMLQEINLDAVYILTPPHETFLIAMDCLTKDKDLFVEKPPGLSVKQARDLASLAKDNNRYVMVGFNRRYVPLMKEVKKRVEEKGYITQCSATFFNVIETPPYGGNVDLMTCDGIHAVDSLRWIAGEVRNIKADVRRIETKFENSFNALLQFEHGAIGHLVFNMMIGGGKGLQIFGMHSRGMSAFVDLSTHEDSDSAILSSASKKIKLNITDVTSSTDYHKLNGFYQENCHFINCLRTRSEPETNIEDAVKNMEVIDQIYSASGKKRTTFAIGKENHRKN